MEPRGLNKKALDQRVAFFRKKKILSHIGELKECAPYYGWVRMGDRDLFMYLNGKDDGVALRWFWLNTFETASLKIWEKSSLLFNTIIDVGAHTGSYSLAAAKLNPQKVILSVEPMPVNLARLSMNREYNELKNIKIIPAAAFSSSTSLTINHHDNYSYCHSGNTVLENKEPSRPSSVKAFKLDDLPVEFIRKALIKIDTEGTENHVIRGASSFLKARSWFLCESTNPKTTQELDKHFSKRDYTFFLIDDEKQTLTKCNSLIPVLHKDKLRMNCLNRLIVPNEDLDNLASLFSK